MEKKNLDAAEDLSKVEEKIQELNEKKNENLFVRDIIPYYTDNYYSNEEISDKHNSNFFIRFFKKLFS
jgi:hypothetical protein